MSLQKENLKYFSDSLSNSYSQIFFSTHKPFALIIFAVSFFDFYAGLCGFLSVLVTSGLAFFLKFDKSTIAKGYYGFNSLLVGLGLGMYYHFEWHLLLIVILASVFTLFLAVASQGIIGKYYVPYLSIPFIFAIWIFIIATQSFESLGISERGIYTLNDLYQLGGNRLIHVHEYFNQLQIPKILSTYFISLSAILFQYSILAGIILSIGLLIYSRIAFTLSLLGFMVAFAFYNIIGASITTIDYSYIGFNYILTSIALGGFFLIPSVKSHLWVVLLIPLVAILTISLHSILLVFKLPVYSLSFNFVVILFIYVLKFRSEYSYSLSEVYYQYNSPEKNLYIFKNNADRFRYRIMKQIKLPFYGAWDVSQGHNGEHTHQKEWRHAWDFVILNKEGKQYKNDGDFPEDYACFGKPVIAPESGIIQKVIDHIPDNTIGEVNLENNWGNTVIIKHDDRLYSKVSHLKQGSIVVAEGEQVVYGQKIGECGNSGRSPYPHLHFQIQENPYIGSLTFDYPLSSYIVQQGKNFEFRSHERPLEKERVSNIEVSELLSKAFHFVPGATMKYTVESENDKRTIDWDVKVNPYNETYLQCQQSGAIAYFEKDDNEFHFTYFEGDKKCYLYHFFLGCYKVQLGFYQGLVLKDKYPLNLSFPKVLRWFHDFIAPFTFLAKSRYHLSYESIDDYMAPEAIDLKAELNNSILSKQLNALHFQIHIRSNGIDAFEFHSKDQHLILTKCEE